MRRALIAVSLFCLALTACGGGGKTVAGDTSNTATNSDSSSPQVTSSNQPFAGGTAQVTVTGGSSSKLALSFDTSSKSVYLSSDGEATGVLVWNAGEDQVFAVEGNLSEGMKKKTSPDGGDRLIVHLVSPGLSFSSSGGDCTVSITASDDSLFQGSAGCTHTSGGKTFTIKATFKAAA